jgi:UDP-glucose 4-epimerase
MTSLNNIQDKVFLIFGGGGFIGANLAGKLSRSGARVISVSRAEVVKPAASGIRNVVANINDVESYRHLLGEADHIVYLISATTPGSSAQDAMLDVQANLTPFITFLEANAAARKLPITFASSGGTVYGVPHYLPIDERHATDPICPYGIVKLAMEKYLAYYSRNHGFAYTILRLANPYGGRFHRRVDQGVIDVFARKISGDQPLTVWGEGAVVRDYVHIDDVCAAFIKAFDYRGMSRVFNIGSGQGHSVLEIIAALAHHTNKSPEITFHPGRRHDIRENVLDITLAKAELDWAPEVRFEDGVVDTIRNVS